MKKKIKILPLIIAAAISALPCVSCGNDDRSSGSGYMYNLTLLNNPQTLDPQNAVDASSQTVIKNMFSGLLEADENGSINCCNAVSYDVSADGKEYTFYLREDNYWFYDMNQNDIIEQGEYFPVVADDYAFALKRLLDPSMHSPYAKDFTCIQHGEPISKGELALELAGVSAISDYVLKINLDYPCAEFPQLLASPAAYPCNEKFFSATKGRYGLDDESVMSNGAFFLRQWFYDPYGHNNILYMKKNEINENEKYEIAPTFLSFDILESESDIRQQFKEEGTACFTSYNCSGYNPEKYSITSSRAVTLGLVFNSDDKIYSDLNLRKALSLSIDRKALEKQLSNDVTTAYGIIPPAINLFGRSYRELSSDSQFDVYNVNDAKSYLEKAKFEIGSRSIESTKILVNSAVVNSGALHLLSQTWQDTLGIYIGIEDVTNDEFYDRIENGDYSIALYPIKCKNASGLSFIRAFEETDCLADFYGDQTCADDILKCPTAAGLVDAYCDAERDVLSKFGFIPLLYKNRYLIADPANEEIFHDAFSGAVNYRKAKNYS